MYVLNVRFEFMLFIKAAYRLYACTFKKDPYSMGQICTKMDAVVFEVVKLMFVLHKSRLYRMTINFYMKGFS